MSIRINRLQFPPQPLELGAIVSQMQELDLWAFLTALSDADLAANRVLYDVEHGGCAMCGRGKKDFVALIGAIHELREQIAERVQIRF